MIDRIKRAVEYFIRKKKLSGRLKALDYNDIIPIAQLNVMNRHVKKTGLETYSFDADEISGLKPTVTRTVTSGVATKPDDFLFLVGISYDYTYNENGATITERKDVDLVRDKDFNKRNASKIVTPTYEYPIAKWVDTGWEVSPSDLAEVEVTYIKNPDTPEWAYNLTNGREVYNAASSTDIALPESMMNEIIMEVLAMVGINIRQADITNYAQIEAKDE